MQLSLQGYSQHVWGIDVGGANLKLCRADGRSAACNFPMWTHFSQLGGSVLQLIDRLGGDWNDRSMMAITMTGELSDCFETRRSGVGGILNQLAGVIDPGQCRVYAVGGQWLSVDQAIEQPWGVAASNWYALAQWCLAGQHWDARRWSAIVDIGSTTVDIIPTGEAKIVTLARTDRERLQQGQLVYTGMERTPLHAIVQAVRIGSETCPIMAEKFATIDDVNLVLSSVQEQPESCDSADGRPRTRRYALARLARMVGEDEETLPEDMLISIANQIALAQSKTVLEALVRNLQPLTPQSRGTSPSLQQQVLVSGHGRALIERLQQLPAARSIDFEFLDRYMPAEAARCAPALAVAQLLATAAISAPSSGD